jgi:hypothetical protein
MIDKYSQIYRIMLPISNTLARIQAEPHVHEYATWKFGSVEGAVQEILTDFFKHAFNGGGGTFRF